MSPLLDSCAIGECATIQQGINTLPTPLCMLLRVCL